MKTLSTVNARIGLRSMVPPMGGMIPRNRLRYGSQSVARGYTICLGGFGNQVRMSLPMSRVLYMLRVEKMPEVMTVSTALSPGIIAANFPWRRGLCARDRVMAPVVGIARSDAASTTRARAPSSARRAAPRISDMRVLISTAPLKCMIVVNLRSCDSSWTCAGLCWLGERAIRIEPRESSRTPRLSSAGKI